MVEIKSKIFAELLKLINETETKVVFSDPTIFNEKIAEHQIKGTLGITE